jgi:hypothetical protein
MGELAATFGVAVTVAVAVAGSGVAVLVSTVVLVAGKIVADGETSGSGLQATGTRKRAANKTNLGERCIYSSWNWESPQGRSNGI